MIDMPLIERNNARLGLGVLIPPSTLKIAVQIPSSAVVARTDGAVLHSV